MYHIMKHGGMILGWGLDKSDGPGEHLKTQCQKQKMLKIRKWNSTSLCSCWINIRKANDNNRSNQLMACNLSGDVFIYSCYMFEIRKRS